MDAFIGNPVPLDSVGQAMADKAVVSFIMGLGIELILHLTPSESLSPVEGESYDSYEVIE
jgi:hypothetical protein